MKPLIFTLILLAVGMFGPISWGQGTIDPPRYDYNVLCYQRASVTEGFSREEMMQCLANQRYAYEQIRKNWQQLPEEVQTGCDEQTRATRVLDYVSLHNCIVTQLRRIPPAPSF